jgi:uncharacterized repeat protein (TIGR01451 family)
MLLALAAGMRTACADLVIESGESFILSAGESVAVDGNLTIQPSAVLDVSAANTQLIVSGNWTNNGSFISGTSSTVTFTDSGTASVISGNSSFYNLTCVTPSKALTFEAGSVQTVNGTLTLNGQAQGTEIVLRSTAPPARWTLNVTAGPQTVQYLDVKDAAADSNNITVQGGINSGHNDDTETSPRWVFDNSLYIISPAGGTQVAPLPTIIGYTTAPNTAFTINGLSGGSAVVVASGTSDASGNYRVVVNSATPLDAGVNTLVPYVGTNAGPPVPVTVAPAPGTAYVPVVNLPASGAKVTGHPFTVQGTALPGSLVKVQALDASGVLVLDVCSAAADSVTGAYSIACDAAAKNLAAGTNTISVTTYTAGGEAITSSGLVTVTFTDPFGIVFDSVSNNPVEGALVTLYYDNDPGPGRSWVQAVAGTHIDVTDINPLTTGADGFYSFNCVDGDFYVTVSAVGYEYPTVKTNAELPAGRTVITGSRGEVFTVSGAVIAMDHPADANGNYVRVTKTANKKEVSVGDVVTYTVTLENISNVDISPVYLKDLIPPGFKYLSGKTLRDGVPVSDPSGNRPLTFTAGELLQGATRTFRYQLVVGSGVTFGEYRNEARAEYRNNIVLSNRATASVRVVPDPTFDLATLIGKVFWDRNANGRQDEGEPGAGTVQIVTEEGKVITTDSEGKYHLAGVIPGRHVLRLDERTLPQGALLTTPKAVIVDVTPGIMAKVNFGLKRTAEEASAYDGDVRIIQEKGQVRPRLNVTLRNDRVLVKDGRLKEPAEFRIFTNYHLFIDRWILEVKDSRTGRIFKLFTGDQGNILKPVIWHAETGDPLLDGKGSYIYQLTVVDRAGDRDTTRPKPFTLVAGGEGPADTGLRKDAEAEEKQARAWFARASLDDGLERQTMRIDGETARVAGAYDGLLRLVQAEKVRGEITLEGRREVTAREVMDGAVDRAEGAGVSAEIILPRGEYDVEVVPYGRDAAGQVVDTAGEPPQGAGGRDQPFRQRIRVGDDHLFFVAMGDARAGYSVNTGSIEPVSGNDSFDKGYWSEGKLAYYLKGKVKGKYLITSSFDTTRQKRELYRNLDPEKYYPVYGDGSSVNDQAGDTRGRLYLLLEWDRSSAVWGNYAADFTDTELAVFRRTLYGGKVHLESARRTAFGESRGKAVAFTSEVKDRAAHDEFLSTGGSLYYLRNRNVLSGTAQVRTEVRDKVTGLVISSKAMQEGVDYELDHDSGRLLFWQPVAMTAASGSVISVQPGAGDPVYVAVDYEHEVTGDLRQGTQGLRMEGALTDRVRLGGTYVQEEQAAADYTLRAADTRWHLGKDILVSGEYAESESEALGSFVSTDGGISFTSLATAATDTGKAYSLKAQARFLGAVGLNAYHRRVEKGFSTPSTVPQAGKEGSGVSAAFDLGPRTKIALAHDVQRLIDSGNIAAHAQVGADETRTTTVQAVHDVSTDKLKLKGEYRVTNVLAKDEAYVTETNRQGGVLALMAEFQLTAKTLLALTQQLSVNGAAGQMTTAQVTNNVSERLSVRVKESVGSEGSLTGMGITLKPFDAKEAEDKVRTGLSSLAVSGDYARSLAAAGASGDSASVGLSARTDATSEARGSFAVTGGGAAGETSSFVLGSEKEVKEGLFSATEKTWTSSSAGKITAERWSLARKAAGLSRELSVSRQTSRDVSSVSNTNIFGLSGDINERWAASASYERGLVNNLDGSQAVRNAAALAAGFVDKDKATGAARFKASGKLEVRLDNGAEDARQYLAYQSAEGRVTPDTTLFAKLNVSRTANLTAGTTLAENRELTLGAAYRPAAVDWLNLVAKYTYLDNNAPASQAGVNDVLREKAHVLSSEGVFDLGTKWQVSEKFAVKTGEELVSGFDFTRTRTWLSVNRLNYRIDDDWKAGAEYRLLRQEQAKDQKQGVLIELVRKIGDSMEVAGGYNFTGFNDDLTRLNYTSQGPYFRITGALFDRTPEEIERIREEKRLRDLEAWAWELVNREMKRPASRIAGVIFDLYSQAEDARQNSRWQEARMRYKKIAEIGRRMFEEAFQYVQDRVELEEELRENRERAESYYRAGQWLKAKDLWKNIIKKANHDKILWEHLLDMR